MFKQLPVVILLFSLCFTFQGCAGLEPQSQDLTEKEDHAGLAYFYKNEAKELREKARVWDTLAESYEHQQDPSSTIEQQQHATYCRAVAASYRKEADKADALATEHQRQIPNRRLGA